jgi:hypothetical protein
VVRVSSHDQQIFCHLCHRDLHDVLVLLVCTLEDLLYVQPLELGKKLYIVVYLCGFWKLGGGLPLLYWLRVGRGRQREQF